MRIIALVEPWVLALALLLVFLLAATVRREDGPVEHSLENTNSFAGKAELNANIERTRNVPPI